MDSINLLTYLERRRLGYAGSRKHVYDMFIGQLGHKPQKSHACKACSSPIDVGNTFACKFSKNKNNLHMVGISTEHGELIIVNTMNECSDPFPYERRGIHSNAIFNFAWAEPEMKLVTACGDHTSKLCSVHPSGKIDVIKEFVCDSSVKSVMFAPGSCEMFVGGYQDGSIKIYDTRMSNGNSVILFDRKIPNAHGVYGSVFKNKKPKKMFGVSTVIYNCDGTLLSCSSMDPYIKHWDLRKSYRQVNGNKEPLPLAKYFDDNMHDTQQSIGYADMVVNSESTRLYASGINNIIHCYSLESPKRMPICKYSGHRHETPYSKISLSNDGRYLFSGCTETAGVIWSTDFPYKEKPIFEVSEPSKELSVSDWCADSNSLKLAASSDSMPKIFSIFPSDVRNNLQIKMHKTMSYESKSFSKFSTIPIKPELKKKYQKETEENMETWDLKNHNKETIVDNLPVTPKRQWEAWFSKTIPPLTSQTSPQIATTLTHSLPVVSNQNVDVVTPVSNKKRKKSVLSPRSLIDQYLVPNSKREKLNTVKEM